MKPTTATTLDAIRDQHKGARVMETNIQRYDHGTSSGPQPEDDGMWVRYSDLLAVESIHDQKGKQ